MFGKNDMLLGKFSLLSHWSKDGKQKWLDQDRESWDQIRRNSTSLAKVAQIIDFLSYFEEGHIQCKISVATFYTTLWGN